MRPVVVASVPLSGPTAALGRDAAAAFQLALDDAGADAELRVVDAGPGPAAPHAAANAAAAVADPAVVAYLGDFHSAATEVSLPLLEAGGVPQVSFSNTYRNLVGAGFFNVMPDDEAGTAGVAAWMAELGVSRPWLTDDREPYGSDMRWLVHRAWAALGRRVAAGPADADAVFFGAVAEDEAAAALERFPDVPLFGMDGLADNQFAAALPAGVRDRLHLVGSPRLTARGREILDRLGDADVHAVYAYEAMALVLDALASAGPDRATLTETLRSTRDRDSVVGRYSFDDRGATTLAEVGRLRFDGTRWAPT